MKTGGSEFQRDTRGSESSSQKKTECVSSKALGGFEGQFDDA